MSTEPTETENGSAPVVEGVDSKTPEPELEPTRSKADWKRKTTHEGITLPSGAVVDIQLPNLGRMVKSGEIPNELLEQAIGQQKKKEITKEVIEESWDYVVFIVPKMVISPDDINEEDVPDLPPQDVEMLASFASRQNDLDAVGHHLGGLETQRRFREARGLLTLDEAIAGTP